MEFSCINNSVKVILKDISINFLLYSLRKYFNSFLDIRDIKRLNVFYKRAARISECNNVTVTYLYILYYTRIISSDYSAAYLLLVGWLRPSGCRVVSTQWALVPTSITASSAPY